MSDAYVLLKTVHILSSTLLFGTGLGTAFFMWFTHRSGQLPAIAFISSSERWSMSTMTTRSETGRRRALAASIRSPAFWSISALKLVNP